MRGTLCGGILAFIVIHRLFILQIWGREKICKRENEASRKGTALEIIK